MKKTVRLYFRLVGVQMRSQLQYPASFIFDILSQVLVMASFFLTIALVIERFGGIAGWSVAQIALLYGMVEMSFGVMDMVFSGFDPDAFSPLVQKGSFDQLLLRPVSIELQILGSRFVLRRLGRIIQGMAILAFAFASGSIHLTAAKVLYLPVIVASQVLFFGALFVTGATLTFWTVQPIEAVNILTYGGTELSSYPMTVYPNWMRVVFTYIIPTVFINYYPALYLLDKPDPFGLPAFAPFLTPVAAALTAAAALTFWRFGLRHYQSTGS